MEEPCPTSPIDDLDEEVENKHEFVPQIQSKGPKNHLSGASIRSEIIQNKHSQNFPHEPHNLNANEFKNPSAIYDMPIRSAPISSDISAQNSSNFSYQRDNIFPSQSNRSNNFSNFEHNQSNFSQNNRSFSNEPRTVFLKRLNNIPEFDEESFETLKKFIEKSETLYYSCTNEAEVNEFFEQLMLRINSETKNLIISLDNFDWESIKAALMSHYSYLCNKNLITTQLENLKQKKDETLIDFAERARKLLRTKTAMYSQLSKEQRDEYNRLASRSFIKGLNNVGLKQRVTTRGANSLEKAIENAIDMELDTINQVSQNELFCRSCRLIGHRERDCRRRNNDNSAVSTLINALKNIGNSNFNRRNNTPFTRNNQQSRFMPRNLNSGSNFNRPFFSK